MISRKKWLTLENPAEISDDNRSDFEEKLNLSGRASNYGCISYKARVLAGFRLLSFTACFISMYPPTVGGLTMLRIAQDTKYYWYLDVACFLKGVACLSDIIRLARLCEYGWGRKPRLHH